MEISRRRFFFFGLAAGVGLMLPDRKIKLTRNELINLIRQDMKNASNEMNRYISNSIYGIPYHYDNSTAGIWLGLPRT